MITLNSGHKTSLTLYFNVYNALNRAAAEDDHVLEAAIKKCGDNNYNIKDRHGYKALLALRKWDILNSNEQISDLIKDIIYSCVEYSNGRYRLNDG